MLRRTWRCRCAEGILVSILVKEYKRTKCFSVCLTGQVQKYGNIFHLMRTLAEKGGWFGVKNPLAEPGCEIDVFLPLLCAENRFLPLYT